MSNEELHIVDRLAKSIADSDNAVDIDSEISKLRTKELRAHLKYACGRLEELGARFREHGHGDCKESARYGAEVGSLLNVRISLKKALESRSLLKKLFD